jgi:hypothetical protein
MQELETGPLHRFQDWPNEQVPKRAAGVYTVWEGDLLLYVGMSGRAMTAEDLEGQRGWSGRGEGPVDPAQQPCVGRRSGDQLCCMSGTASWSRALLHPNSNSWPPATCRSTASSERSFASD